VPEVQSQQIKTGWCILLISGFSYLCFFEFVDHLAKRNPNFNSSFNNKIKG